MKILLATGNQNKIREFRGLFTEFPLEVLASGDIPGLELPPETGHTFTENALIKARYAASYSGLSTVADDSGLVVEALGGAPGVYSARYAGAGATDRENRDKLLLEMQGVSKAKRGASFVCALAYVEPGAGLEKIFTGTLDGCITTAPSGEGGFGYDPVFFVPKKGKTAAELSMGEKNAISHRGVALRKFRKWFALREEEKECRDALEKAMAVLTPEVLARLEEE